MALKGTSEGIHGVASDCSLISIACSISSRPIQKKKAMPGKNAIRYSVASMMPFVRSDQLL